MQRVERGRPLLPPGVFPLQDIKPSKSMFWVHYLNVTLGKTIGDSQEFVFVALTQQDIAELGEMPSLRSIAATFLRKILSTQSKGPYMLGGLCIGAILAYEIAVQLRAAGYEVSLLVLVDPPSPLYLKSKDAMSSKFTQPLYLLSRATHMGLRRALLRSGQRVAERLRTSMGVKAKAMKEGPAQQLIETSAKEYYPERYDGRVLLLLASERPPHVDFLPSWKAVIPENLHIHYVSGHHNDLMKAPCVGEIAEAIVFYRELSIQNDVSNRLFDNAKLNSSPTDHSRSFGSFIIQGMNNEFETGELQSSVRAAVVNQPE
jgi:thioesterase domain-containing protein